MLTVTKLYKNCRFLFLTFDGCNVSWQNKNDYVKTIADRTLLNCRCEYGRETKFDHYNLVKFLFSS